MYVHSATCSCNIELLDSKKAVLCTCIFTDFFPNWHFFSIRYIINIAGRISKAAMGGGGGGGGATNPFLPVLHVPKKMGARTRGQNSLVYKEFVFLPKGPFTESWIVYTNEKNSRTKMLFGYM
jgi:hypothetical protein